MCTRCSVNGPVSLCVIQVGQDRWHRDNELSGVMVYFENCLVDSYARGQGLPDVVQKTELGYLAIVSFSGPSDKRLFHPNPTKVSLFSYTPKMLTITPPHQQSLSSYLNIPWSSELSPPDNGGGSRGAQICVARPTLFLRVSQVGFPTDNDRYIHVLEAAGEALTQVVQNVNVPNEKPLAENEEVDYWIECHWCGKSRKVSKEYFDVNEASQTWHCGIEGSPVPSPEEGRCVCVFAW